MDIKMNESHENNSDPLLDISNSQRSSKFRLLIVGAGRIGAKVLLQLKKNPTLLVYTVDPRETPYAVEEGIIASVDYQKELTPKDLEPVIEEIEPDIVLVTTSREDIGRSNVPGLEVLVEALRQELEATSKVPIIAVSRTSLI
jgi:hypothetical protein